MENSYCGKSCVDCLDKAEVGCPGCKAGPGKESGTLCEIANCCKGRYKDACATCISNASCILLSEREGMVRKWNGVGRSVRAEVPVAMNSADADGDAYTGDTGRRARDRRDAGLIRSSLIAIFWLFLFGGVGNVLSNENVFGTMPGVILVGAIISLVAGIAQAVFMIRLGTEERAYKVAGVCNLVATGASFVAGVFTTGLAVVMKFSGGTAGNVIGLFLGLLLLVAALVLEIISGYQFLVANARVVERRDPALSDRWSVMSKLFFAVMGGILVVPFIVAFLPVVGLLVGFVYILGVMAFGICEYVFLYQTANRFRE